jgi:pSer/pThr/pTyr-binding forkhead associated (FHA) protein
MRTGADFMSILSQLGVVILIAFIFVVIGKANRDLNNINEEGEHFVDEWELRQQKKELRLQQKQEEKEQKKLSHVPEDFQGEDQEEEREEYPEETDINGNMDMGRENVISMNHYKNTGITLVERNEQHEPVRRISVNQLPFLIGRDADNHLVLDDLCVAKKHCRIVEEGGQYVLEDVGTKNKLFVNGMITDRMVLSDHLRLFIGNVEFVVEMGMQRSGSTRIHQGMRERYYE